VRGYVVRRDVRGMSLQCSGRTGGVCSDNGTMDQGGVEATGGATGAALDAAIAGASSQQETGTHASRKATIRWWDGVRGMWEQIPGVTVSGQYTDSLGRTGTALSFGSSTIVVDISNGQVLAELDGARPSRWDASAPARLATPMPRALSAAAAPLCTSARARSTASRTL
jgi:hypothetical protein